MGHLPDYICTECGLKTPRENLTAKKVSFGTLGSSSIMLKSRTVAWLCDPCCNKDPAWQLAEYESPGFKQAEEMEEVARTARQMRRLEAGQPADETPPSGIPTVQDDSNS